jgi:hypothetical protein
MSTVEETTLIIEKINELKLLFVKAQEYNSASTMREMEKTYKVKLRRNIQIEKK